MQRLFNSQGLHVATVKGERLYSVRGRHIGHLDTNRNIFIDKSGRYLGEVYRDDRLVTNPYSSHANTSFGIRGTSGNIGVITVSTRPMITLPSKFKDVDPSALEG